jgi:hypothetical protein
MNLKLISFFTLALISISVQSQVIVFQDTDHIVHCEMVNDSLKVTVEVLNDNTINLSANSTATMNDDFVQLMFDYNTSGGIDFGSEVDLIYQYDSTLNNNVCGSHVTGPTTITACGTATTTGSAGAKLGTSVYSASQHLIWSFCIPKLELDNGNTLCARMSVNIHTDGDSLSSTTKIPTSPDTYFVDVYNPVMLYEAGDLGADINVCVGDTIWPNDDYPFYFWNNVPFDGQYTLVVNYLSEYGFKMNDGTCIISDSLKVNILDDTYCAGSTYGFPNLLSPNGDDMNETFEPIIGQDLLNQDWTGAKLQIFNRWGVSIYESPENAYPFWDLRNEVGDVASSGTYYFTFMPPGENATLLNGFFMVLNDN